MQLDGGMMTYSVLLAGSGNIGRRHLEALLACAPNMDLEIDVIEPFAPAREATAALVKTRLGPSMASDNHQVRLHADLNAAPRATDLASIATDAAPRRSVFDAVHAHARVGAWVFEKVLFQTRRDLDEVGHLLTHDGSPAFVNCGRRGFPGYLDLKARLAERRIERMQVRGSQFGLACNAIHFTDLLEFMTGEPLDRIDTSGLEPGHVDSKRKGYVEVFGTLSGATTGGVRFDLECLNAPGTPLEMRFEGEGWSARVSEGTGTLVFEDKRQTETVPFETRYVSQMPYLFTDILETGRSALPAYESSAAQHRLLLDALRPHLGLDVGADEPCPIS